MPVLANYQYLLDVKKELIRLQKRIISSVKAKETIEYSFIHNNPKLDHLLNIQGNNFLTSIENSKIGLESLDVAKLYVENENLNIDYTGLLIERFNNINPFYYDYFRYMVLLLYVEGLVLSTDEYINAQMFINTTNSIKKYFDKRIETVVLIDNIKRHIAKNNKEMAFITGSDETTSSDFILFNDYINELTGIKEGDLVRIFGKVERNRDKYSIIVSKIEKI